MTDLQQVAERLRKLYLFREASTEVLVATLDEIYGKGNRLNAYSDECCAAEDWLAERDTTPLTVEVLEKIIAENEQDAKEWLIEWYESISIRNHKLTVGQLRTFARLAGVKLKQPESTP